MHRSLVAFCFAAQSPERPARSKRKVSRKACRRFQSGGSRSTVRGTCGLRLLRHSQCVGSRLPSCRTGKVRNRKRSTFRCWNRRGQHRRQNDRNDGFRQASHLAPSLPCDFGFFPDVDCHPTLSGLHRPPDLLGRRRHVDAWPPAVRDRVGDRVHRGRRASRWCRLRPRPSRRADWWWPARCAGRPGSAACGGRAACA